MRIGTEDAIRRFVDAVNLVDACASPRNHVLVLPPDRQAGTGYLG
jgi:hypothetical protein